VGRFKLWVFLTVLALMLIMSIVAAVENTQHHVFVGTVTVDGQAVPYGTEINALVEGQEEGSFQVYNPGDYGPLNVGEPACGSLITFWVNGHPGSPDLKLRERTATILDPTVDTDKSRDASHTHAYQQANRQATQAPNRAAPPANSKHPRDQKPSAPNQSASNTNYQPIPPTRPTLSASPPTANNHQHPHSSANNHEQPSIQHGAHQSTPVISTHPTSPTLSHQPCPVCQDGNTWGNNGGGGSSIEGCRSLFSLAG
jgi:hypothetical protein